MNIASNMLKLETLRVALAAMQSAKTIIESTISGQKLVAALIGLGFLKGKDTPTQPIEEEKLPAANLERLATANSDDLPARPMIDRKVIAIPEKPAARQRANNSAVELLKQIEAEGLTRDDLSAEQIEALATYTGSGGGLKADDGRVGSAFEYYTPKEVATELWDVAAAFGFKGGKVLDPSAGTGIFAAMSPENAVVDSIELDSISGGIAKVLNDGSRSNTIISPFELQAKTMADNSLDMVITNVPFGDNKTRGANAMLDDSYQKEPLQNYFILRSLEKLKYGGLAIFIVPTSVVSGVEAVAKKMRHKASLKAELLGACRLPTSVFEQTGADVVTDVIIFRKFSREVSDKIDDLYAAGDIDTLTRANVLWPEYLNGKYFKQPENKKFILGEVVEKTNRWGKVIETVQDHGGVGKKTTPEISKMMRKFGKSRIDWEALDAAETEVIEYKNGDTVFQNGQQLQYKDGQWQVMAKEVTDTDREIQDRLAVMGNALDMVIAGVTYAQVEQVISYSEKTNQNDLIPRKAQALITRTQTLAPAMRASAWACVICSQAIQDAIEAHEYGFNFVTGEVKLTAFMKTAFLDGKNAKLTGDPKQDHNRVALFYGNGKYNAAWRGDVNTDIADNADVSSYQSHIGRLQYENKSLFLSREQLAQIDPAADPMKSNEWFINADGSQVIAANDFLVGSLADRLADIDKEIAKATDSDIIDKLMRQKDFARENVSRIDLVNVQLDLRTPLIGAEDKVRFLKQSVHVDAFIGVTTAGDPIADIDVKEKKGTQKNQDLAKLYNRIGDWIKKGTISLGGVGLVVTTQREALDWLTEEINKANVKFNVWAKADKSVMDKLAEKTGNDANVFFTQNEDETPIDIAGMNPALALHGYQNAFVRGQGRFFGGINGMGVGLGKAQPLTAKVLTPTGWRLMGSLEKGDSIIAFDGTNAIVTGVYPQGEKDVYEVVFSDGAKTECCDEHLWLTETESDRKRQRRHKRDNKEYLQDTYNSVKSLTDIKQSLLIGAKQKNHKIPMVSGILMPYREHLIKDYALGVLLGDGCFSNKPTSITTNEGELAAKVIDLIKQGFGDSVRVTKRDDAEKAVSYQFVTENNKGINLLRQELNRLGLGGLKAQEKFVPDEYMTGSESQRLSLLQGLMDTDGYVSKDGITTQFYSTSKKLALNIIELIQSLGGNAWYSIKKDPAYTYKNEKLTGSDCYIVSMRLPENIKPFTLSRKSDRYKHNAKYRPTRYFTEVNYLGKKQAQCISIDHPSHLYITDDYIVTHNTFSSLSSVQHVHNIGVKKKTIFVVPNSVLSNWRKEATFAYENTDDCIFIGLRENGDKFRVFSNKYDEDLLAAVDGKYRKIFMTFEAFKRMRLKEDTIADYTQYVKDTDSAYEDKLTHKDDERTKGMTADMIKLLTVNSNAPFLEDMKIDSVVVDEAHGFKNSVTAPTTDNGIRYLSQPKTSARGEDAQAKLWYIRSLTANKDGVQLLTATPITNSPLEIYSMMALASGRDTVNKMCGGIQGADDFIKIMCQIEEETLPTIDGGERSQNVFTGIRNAQILRALVNSQAVIKDAQDVGMSVVIPDRELTATAVVLDPAAAQQLQEFQDAYTTAKELVKEYPDPALDNPDHPQSPSSPNSPISRVMAKYGEPIELIAAPFNLIRKMDVVIADAEFAERASFYDFEPAQEKIAQKVIDAFNAKAYIEKRKQLSPYTNPDDATEILVKEDKKMVLKGYKIQAMAKIILHSGRKRIVIDSLNGKTQTNFETLADKAGLNLDVTISAKVAALIENFKAEQASPRGAADDGTASNIVKQIIFCDHLFLHNKIKKSLAKLAGVSASKIAIITGQVNNEPDEMIDIQDGFNAHGDDNQYQVIIANEKAEVGINLQRGTQAIHHLTTGWTPDSLEQRNGRGARQGNKTQKVAIYHYDADGTFDEFKRTMIDKKDEWITGVLKGDGKNTIKVSGSITNTEKDALITAGGSKEAMREYQRTREANEIAAARTLAIKRQGINIEVMQEQTDLMAKISPASYYNQALIDIISIIRENKTLNTKNENPKISKIALQKGLALFEQQKEVAINALDDLINSVSIYEMTRDANYQYTATGNVVKANKTAAQMYQNIYDDAKDYKPSEVRNWRSTFEKKELGSGINWTYKEAKVDDDSFYQASFDEARATAESLINQSVIAANFIADETGIEGISLPPDAGALITSRQATVVEGLFVTVGAFLYNTETNDVSELYVINKNLEAVRAYEEGGKLKTNIDKIKNIYVGKKQAILPSDSRYLDYVKKVAALEDDWNKRTLLTRNNAMYSDALPMVAEYRDGNVKPLWDIANTVEDQHAQLENCSAKYMLPLTMFGAGTAFASAAIDFYEKHNVTIDASAGKFSVDDESVNVIPNKLGINIGYYQVLYDDFIVEIVKATGAKVSKGDSYIFNRAMLMMKLVKYDHDNLMTGLDALMAKITADSEPSTFKRLAVKVYNDYVSDKEFTTGIEDDDMKIDILSLVYGKVKVGIFGNYDLIDRMNKRLTIMKDEAAKPEDKRQAEPVANDESPAPASQDISDETTVFIGGETKNNMSTIKLYAKEYGHVVAKGKKACWYGKQGVWAVSFIVWRNMLADRPNLANELTMRTNYN